MLGKRFEFDGHSIVKLNKNQIEMKKRIDFKFKHRIYRFISIPCCICNGKKFLKLSNKDHHGIYMSVVICQQCGLIQTNPRMTQESFNEFYNHEYRILNLGNIRPTNHFFSMQYLRGRKIYSYLLYNRIYKKPLHKLSILEVGCGSGGILKFFREKGCRVTGIDVNKEYIEFGRDNYGLDLIVGTISDLSLEKSPDIILYSHVLEHILNLKKELSNISRIISDNGYLYISVPGVKNLSNNYEMDFLRFLRMTHTYHFSLTTLKNLMEIKGFQLLIGDESIRSIFQKSKQVTFMKKLRNDYIPAIMYLNSTEIIRRLYFLRDFYKHSSYIIHNPILFYQNILKDHKSILPRVFST